MYFISFLIGAILFILASLSPEQTWAQNKKSNDPSAQPSAQAAEDERVNVEAIKQKYWARGEETEIGVVQNRLYSKAKKFQFGMFAGTIVNDPFLSNRSLGLHTGYNLSEYFAIQAVIYRAISSPSDAQTYFFERFTLIPPTNRPRAYYGLEGNFSLIYGKLSLLGKAIIYYDLHTTAGLGIMSTHNGNYFSPSLGLGQQFYLAQNLSLRIDYRLFIYREKLYNNVAGNPQNGTLFGERTNFTNSISVGLQYMFQFGGKK